MDETSLPDIPEWIMVPDIPEWIMVSLLLEFAVLAAQICPAKTVFAELAAATFAG